MGKTKKKIDKNQCFTSINVWSLKMYTIHVKIASIPNLTLDPPRGAHFKEETLKILRFFVFEF